MLQPTSYDGGVRIVVDVIEKQNVASLLKEKGSRNKYRKRRYR